MSEPPDPGTDETAAPSPSGSPTGKASAGGAPLDVRRARRSNLAFASALLTGAVFVAGFTLWGAPKIAPELSAFLAEYPSPETLQAEIDGLSAQADAAQRRADANRTAIDDLELQLSSIARTAEGASEDFARQADGIDALRAGLAALSADVEALKSEGVQGDGGGQTAVSGAAPHTDGTLDDMEALKAAVAALQGRLNEAEEILKGLPRPDAVRSSLGDAEIRNAVKELQILIAHGLPYAGALARVEKLSGVPAPNALSAPGGDGLPSMAALRRTFPAAARTALAADKQPVEGEDPLAKIAAWFDSQVSVRPVQPVDGISTGAVLSRIEAALEVDDGPRALAEAESLSRTAADAMADWLSQLKAKTAAEAALASYIAAAGGES